MTKKERQVWGERTKQKYQEKNVLPSTASLSKGTCGFPQSPSTSRGRGPAEISEPARHQVRAERTWGNYLAFARPPPVSPRPVLISVPKYMGCYISYFSVEIQVLHLKFRHIYWNNTPARVRRRKLGICLGTLTLFSLNGKSSRRSCQK